MIHFAVSEPRNSGLPINLIEANPKEGEVVKEDESTMSLFLARVASGVAGVIIIPRVFGQHARKFTSHRSQGVAEWTEKYCPEIFANYRKKMFSLVEAGEQCLSLRKDRYSQKACDPEGPQSACVGQQIQLDIDTWQLNHYKNELGKTHRSPFRSTTEKVTGRFIDTFISFTMGVVAGHITYSLTRHIFRQMKRHGSVQKGE